MFLQRHAKEEKLLATQQAAAEAETSTRQIQQAASRLQPTLKSLVKALKAAGPAEAPAAPTPTAQGNLL